MKETKNISRSSTESSAAIEKCTLQCAIYSTGVYKPMGISGDTLREALLALRPEIYGNIAEEK
jgi:hypothetical protein